MPLIRPSYRIGSVLQLTPDWLVRLGLRALLLDVDCTLKRYGQSELSADVVDWIARLTAADVRLCLVSNGLKTRIEPLAARHGLPVVARAMKPLPAGCRRAIALLGVEASEAAMVGDQLFADIMAGNLAGLRTILVDPIHPEEEPWFTRLKRPVERWIVRNMPRDA